MKKVLKFPIGESDFACVRQGNYHYVDKSLFIQQIVEDGAKTLLFPRPRRFGKTLNLSMLRYFFEKSKGSKETEIEQRRALFSGLLIEQEKEAWQHFAKYPVIFLTFKDVKTNSWEESVVKLKELFSELFTTHSVIQEKLAPQEQEYFHNVLFRKVSTTELSSALLFLSKHLQDYHEEKVIILMDEYDTCLHEAYAKGYYQEAIAFFRNLLSGAFKDNSALYKGVMTGILRIAKESLFSGLNNLSVYSLLHHKFATSFGFTEAEVMDLVKQVAGSAPFAQLKSWYNGYLFGGQTLYNPWSILNYLAQPEEGLKAYWVNTSSYDLIETLLFKSGFSTQTEVETLLQGGSIDKPLEEDLALRDLTADSLWSFLLFCGYLKATKQYQKGRVPYVTLTLPNFEVETAFFSLTRSWFQKQLGRSKSAESFFQALLSGNAEKVEEVLCYLMKVSMSYWDTPSGTASAEETKSKQAEFGKQTTTHMDDGNAMENRTSQKSKEEEKTDPEAVYHALLLGMLIFLREDYDIRSNPESGYGRSDLMLIPKVKGKPGVVMEFKVVKKGKQPEVVLQEAWNQIKEKQYNTELQERGASVIIEYAIAFSGKRAYVKGDE